MTDSMTDQFLDDRKEQEERTFAVFDQYIPLTKESLLARAEVERLDFLTCQQLSGVAAEELTGKGSELEKDIVAYAGVYIFTDLANKRVLKIGETKTLRQRIAKAHLRHWNQSARADLCGFYHASGLPWPQSIEEDEITLCVIPMAKSSQRWRRALEYWLQEKLHPVIDH